MHFWWWWWFIISYLRRDLTRTTTSISLNKTITPSNWPFPGLHWTSPHQHQQCIDKNHNRQHCIDWKYYHQHFIDQYHITSIALIRIIVTSTGLTRTRKNKMAASWRKAVAFDIFKQKSLFTKQSHPKYQWIYNEMAGKGLFDWFYVIALTKAQVIELKRG